MPQTLDDRHRYIRRRRAAAVAVAVVALFLVVVAVFMLSRPVRSVSPVSPTLAPTVSASPLADTGYVDPSQAPAPGMDPRFAPPDGPAKDYPPFDVDAISMRDELRTHGVDTPDDKLNTLVLIADKYIAQDDPDLDAWDPRIMRDVRTMYPQATHAEVIDVTRCLAEYVERVIARNHGWAHPPDEDDHDVTVQGRGPVPHPAAPITPTR